MADTHFSCTTCTKFSWLTSTRRWLARAGPQIKWEKMSSMNICLRRAVQSEVRLALFWSWRVPAILVLTCRFLLQALPAVLRLLDMVESVASLSEVTMGHPPLMRSMAQTFLECWRVTHQDMGTLQSCAWNRHSRNISLS